MRVIEHEKIKTEFSQVPTWVSALLPTSSEHQPTDIYISSSNRPTDVNILPLWKAVHHLAEVSNGVIAGATFNTDGIVAKVSGCQYAPGCTDAIQQPSPSFDGIQAIILAAGRGTRMGRLTETTPKSLLPIGESQLINPIVEATLNCDHITSRTVMMWDNPAFPNQYHDKFIEWARWQPGIRLANQNSEAMLRSLIILMMKEDERFSLAFNGDKWIGTQFDLTAILPELYELLHQHPFVIVGKRSNTSKRMAVMGEDLIIHDLERKNQDGGYDTERVGVGIAFIAFDTARMPVLVNRLSDASTVTDLISVLTSAGIRGRFFELPDEFGWKNVNTPSDLAEIASVQETNQDGSTTPCLYQEIRQLKGGRSSSKLTLVRSDRGVYVAKSDSGKIPIDESGLTQRQFALLDHMIGGNHKGGISNTVHHCDACGSRECSVSPFITGKNLDSILMIDKNLEGVTTAMRTLIDQMSRAGYFARYKLSSDRSMWVKWLADRRMKQISRVLSLPIEEQEIYWNIDGMDLKTIYAEAVEYLTESTDLIPIGLFPRDLNPGNIFVLADGSIRIVDQYMMGGDPVIVPIKLTIGWRLLSNSLTTTGEHTPDIETAQTLQDAIDTIDQRTLEQFLCLYPFDSTFVRRYHAAMLVRHIIGVIRIVEESARYNYDRSPLIGQVANYIQTSYHQMRDG